MNKSIFFAAACWFTLTTLILLAEAVDDDAKEQKKTKKYQGMIDNFKDQLTNMVDEAVEAIEDLKNKTLENFEKMQVDVIEAHESYVDQLVKAHANLITSYKKNYDSLHDNLKENYEKLSGQAKTNYETNFEKFKKYCEDIKKNNPTLPQKMFDDAIGTIENASKKQNETYEKYYNEVKTAFQSGYEVNLKKMVIPGIGVSGTSGGSDVSTTESPSTAITNSVKH